MKLWSNNINQFDDALERFARGEFDFLEIYSNSEVPHDFDALSKLKAIPVLGVHIGHLDTAGFHTFFLTDDQVPAWRATVALADFFDAPRIVVHPATTHTSKTFWENADRLDDPRIVIESMPAISPLGGPTRTFGITAEDLKDIAQKKNICFDVAKSIKAAIYLNKDYKIFISDCVDTLQPEYFHISGCHIDNPVDEHGNMWDATYDVAWFRSVLERVARKKDIFLVFETPKIGLDLENDIKNMIYFKEAL